MAAALDQLLEVDGGFAPGFGLHADQGHGEAQVIVGGVLLNQGGELAHGVFQAFLFDQQARIGQAQALVLGMLPQAFLQQCEGLVAALQAMQQARLEQDGGDLPLLGRLLLQQGERFLAAIVLLQKYGLAKGQLRIVRVPGQQLVEALQQAGAGVRIGFRSRQGEEVEVRVALALQDLFHELHGFLVAPGARQLHGGGALGVEVLRCIACPDQRGVQRSLVGAEVFGDAKAALGDTGILRRMCLLHIVAQSDIEAVALAGEFRDQQCIEGLTGERAVLGDLAGGGLRRSVLDRRAAFRRLLGEGLAAAENQQGGKCGESIHRGKCTAGVRSRHDDTSRRASPWPHGARRPVWPAFGRTNRIRQSRAMVVLHLAK